MCVIYITCTNTYVSCTLYRELIPDVTGQLYRPALGTAWAHCLHTRLVLYRAPKMVPTSISGGAVGAGVGGVGVGHEDDRGDMSTIVSASRTMGNRTIGTEGSLIMGHNYDRRIMISKSPTGMCVIMSCMRVIMSYMLTVSALFPAYFTLNFALFSP